MPLVVMKEVSVLPVINVPLRNIPPYWGRALRGTAYTVRKSNLSSIWQSREHWRYSDKALGWTLGEGRERPWFGVV